MTDFEQAVIERLDRIGDALDKTVRPLVVNISGEHLDPASLDRLRAQLDEFFSEKNLKAGKFR